jgi:ligand-binding sensor domain-containing protein/two-component sensor histidine kinase
MSRYSRIAGYLLLIYSIFYYLPLSGQESKWYLKFNHIGSDKGLSEPTNHFVFKDSKGYVWISSVEGLNRFDGRRVKVYKSDPNEPSTLLDDNIQSPFFEDNKSDIWFTTVNGVHVYRRGRDSFDRFTVPTNNGVPNPVGYTALCLEQNRWLWVQVDGKIYKFDTKSSIQSNWFFLHDLDAVRFSVDTFTNGKVHRIVACYWSAQEGIDILDYNNQGKLIEKKTYFSKNQTQYPPLTIQQTLIENDTLIWLTTNQSLIKINPENPGNFKTFNPFPFGTKIANITLLNNNELWITSDQTPLLKFNKKKEIFEDKVFSYAELSKKISRTAQLYEDKSQNIWVSTYKNGVYHSNVCSQFFFNPFNLFAKFPHSIEQIVEDKKGGFWLTYSSEHIKKSGYAHIAKDKTLIKKEQPQPTLSKFFQSKNNKLWYSKRQESLNLYDFEKLQFNEILKDNLQEIRALNEINDSTLLIGSKVGLFYFDIKTKLIQKDTFDIIPYIFYNTNKYLWIDTQDENIYCVLINKNRISQILKKFKSYNCINYFFQSKTTPSVLWVATAKGLVKINTESLTDTLFTVKDGLPSNYIQAVLEDKQGNLWCSTNNGIAKYNPVLKQAKLFTRKQGLSSDTYNQGAALLSSTGEMWFGGTNGVDVFHPDSIKDQSQAPQAAIVGLKIYDKYWKGDTAIEEKQHVRLKYFENTLTFELAAMEYTDPEQNRYKVMLEGEGQKSEWSDLGTQNFVTFVNLREGRYVFKLLTANSEGVWNDTPKTLTIDIQPPYWRTWWFYALMTVLICSFFYGLYRYRLFQVLKMQRLRNRISADLHDDIGATLSNVNILTTLVRQRLPNDVDVLPLLMRIEEEISTSSESLDDIIWSVNPQNDSMERVLSRMRQYANEVFDARGIEGTLDFDSNLSNLSLPMDKRRDFYLIFKEALNNLSKYAQCAKATVSLKETEGRLKLVVSDNGIGFDPLSKKEGNGQKTMRQRAERLKADLVIDSAVGKGTRVELSLPFV